MTDARNSSPRICSSFKITVLNSSDSKLFIFTETAFPKASEFSDMLKVVADVCGKRFCDS